MTRNTPAVVDNTSCFTTIRTYLVSWAVMSPEEGDGKTPEREVGKGIWGSGTAYARRFSLSEYGETTIYVQSCTTYCDPTGFSSCLGIVRGGANHSLCNFHVK